MKIQGRLSVSMLLKPFVMPQKSEEFPLHPLLTVLTYFVVSRYTRTLLLICIVFFTHYAMAEDVKNFSIPIVVQFANTDTASINPGFVDELSRAVGVTLSYSQSTAEGMHMFLVNGLFESFPVSDILQRLRRRSDVISAVADSANSNSATGLIMIKFSVSVADPAHPDFVLSLSKDVGITLTHLFEKSRGIQAFRVNGLSQQTQLDLILHRFKYRKDVLSAKASR